MLEYFIDLLIIPLVMVSYYQSIKLTGLLNLGMIYFFFILFVIIHFFSSLLIILSNYAVYHQFRGSMWLLGFGPTIASLFALVLVTFLPFFKWPFYIFKWVPNFDKLITPFIMGIAAFITQILLRKTVNDSIFKIDYNLDKDQMNNSPKSHSNEISNTDQPNEISNTDQPNEISNTDQPNEIPDTNHNPQ